MKHTNILYAKAFLAALSDSPSKEDAITKKFVALLKNLGSKRNALQIVRAVEAEIVRRAGGRNVTIESARPINEALLAEIKKQFSDRDRVSVEVKPELIAGIRVRFNESFLIDASLQRRLQKLFS